MLKLAEILRALENWGVRYCLLRGGENRDGADRADPRREVDLLVAPEDAARFRQVVENFGFVPLPTWGYAPHRSYIAYEPERGWLKLDTVADLCFGTRIKPLRVALTRECLARRLGPSGGRRPAPEHEFVLLLLHCLLDKSAFPSRHQARLEAIRSRAATDPRLERRLSACFARYLEPAIAWPEASRAVAAGDWAGLLARRRAVVLELCRREPLSSLLRWASARVLLALRPLFIAARRRGSSAAILGPDGAGKSSLAGSLARDPELRARVVYMGTNGRGTHAGRSNGRPLGRAARFVRRFLEQRTQATVGLYHRLRGRIVLYDRHPWEGLGASPEPRSWGRALRRRLMQTAPRPDLVLVLDAPAAVLHRRKQQHGIDGLEAQRQRYLALVGRLPQAVVIDTTAGPEEVVRAATALLFENQRQQTRRSHDPRQPARS